MAISLPIENVLIQVRAKLQSEHIKLWLPPYYEEGIGPVDSELEKLTSSMCQVLNIPYDYCLAAVNELQTSALDKLKARDEFSRTGLATLKVRVPNKNTGARLLTVQSKFDVPAEGLYESVANQLGIPATNVKLISFGRVLNRSQTLADQEVQNNQQVLAIIMETTSEEANKENAHYDHFQAAKSDAETLLNQSDSYMDMEDQDGNIIHLPPEEKKALLMALAMHEKGRSALKREDFNGALILLLDADNEYKMCNSQMLGTVDNYALLNLDIVWCYLMLKSVTQLPDAAKRLKICEQNFKKSYGDNLNRVVSLKGNAINERALIMRLHLLQAILHFHQNQRTDARRLLELAEMEFGQLQIDENSVTALIEMGYTATEARIGLRACSNNIDQALNYIQERQQQRKNARQIGSAQRQLKSSVVKTKDDKWVNPRNLHILSEMGFEKNVCAIALRNADNDINQAIVLLQENQAALQEELMREIVPSTKLRDKMLAMGFHAEIIDMALKNSSNEMDTAVEELLRLQSNGTYDSVLTDLMKTAGDIIERAASPNGPSTSSKALRDLQKESEAFERFSEDVQNADDDYLDLPLVQERKLLLEYKNLFDL